MYLLRKYSSAIKIAASFFIVLVFYRSWFLFPEIIGGDWPYVYTQFLGQVDLLPTLWTPVHGNGLGGINPAFFLQYFSYFLLWMSVQIHMPWWIVYKLFWFYPFIAVSFSSSYFLARFLGFKKLYASITGLIYTTNTYILLMAAGGQMGISVAYALVPLVLLYFFKWFMEEQPKKNRFSSSLILASLFSLLGMFDPRVLYMVAGVCVLCTGTYYGVFKSLDKFFIKKLVVVIGVGILLSAFWLIPMFLVSGEQLATMGKEHTDANALPFFSVAKLENSLSLLHPNYPENIFGKVYFLRTRFLLLPTLAFLAVFFLPTTKDRLKKFFILFFSLLSIVGIFLSKGTNEPFGGLYSFFFKYVPGFVVFRDPTKWYMLVALSFAILIPSSLNSISEFLFAKHTVFKNKSLVLLIFLFSWTFLSIDVFLGNVGGTFKPLKVPEEYTMLAQSLASDTSFSRTLWVPKRHRFSFDSMTHPAIEASVLWNSPTDSAFEEFTAPSTKNIFNNYAIEYVIVPYDSTNELFIKDGKYAKETRDSIVATLDGIPWLTKIQDGQVTVYKTSSHNNRFFLQSGERVEWKEVGPNQYEVIVQNSIPQPLVFSENYNSSWKLMQGEKEIRPKQTIENLMEFNNLPASYTARVYFSGEKYVRLGYMVTLLTIFGCILFVWKKRL